MRTAIQILALLGLCLLCGCGPNNDNHAPEPTPRTVLVYMAANNDLGLNNWDARDIAEMRKAVEADALNGGRLLVYHDDYNSTPTLFEITKDGNNTLRTYSTDAAAIDIDRMKEVMSDIKSLAPNKEYGLVLWSHGTGWVEDEGSRSAVTLNPYSFGAHWNDNGSQAKMKITSLAKALEGEDFEFIYFDNCHMGTIEVVYEMRNAARKIVASATELPLEGMPYDRNIPVFFEKNLDITKAAKNTYDYYCSPDASTNSCTISVIDTRQLDNLASVTGNIMASAPSLPDDYKPIPLFRQSVVADGGIYDMAHYISALDIDASKLNTWRSAYNSAIPYHASTQKSYGLDTSKFSGLGCNILQKASDATILGYENLSWWKNVISRNPALH